MNRRQFSRTLAGACAGALAAPADRPNIVLCMGDDHGWNETAYNGHPYLRTPVLDEMAASGLRLDRFYSAHPNCSPTRGSIMTGRHPNRYGTFAPNWSIRPEEITIAQLLRSSGYACGHFGKWHLGPVKRESPTCPGAMGFDEWLSHDNFYEVDPWLARNGEKPRQYPGESSEIVVREALRFIGKAKADRKPFFTVIWFGSPHAPYVGVEPYLSMYRDAPEAIRARLAEISAMDHAMGILRTELKRQGVSPNTLVWYCGDNGVVPEGRLTTPYRGAKGDVYEGGIRVPGIIEWPERIAKPMASSVNAVTTDILPTLCDLTGVRLPRRPLDGLSLKPLIEGRMRERPQPVYFWEFDASRERNREPYLALSLQAGTTPTATERDGKLTRDFQNFRHPRIEDGDYAGQAAVLGNRYKLVVDGPEGRGAARRRPAGSKRELFDLAADRGETTNLASSKPEIAAEMERGLRVWQKSVLTSLTGADYTAG